MLDNDLYRALEAEAKDRLGVDYFGAADLTVARDYIERHAPDFRLTYPRALSLGIRLCDDVVDNIYDQYVRDAVYTYCHHIYGVISPRLDQVALAIAKQLQDRGYRAYPLPSSGNSWAKNNEGIVLQDPNKLGPIAVSHKMIANLAGLGWIGRNCLFTTPECGPRVRLVSILTDAPLPTGQMQANRCGACNNCVEVCPVHALTGKEFHPNDPLSERLDALACHNYRCGTVMPQLQVLGCALCLYVCPYGHARREPYHMTQRKPIRTLPPIPAQPA